MIFHPQKTKTFQQEKFWKTSNEKKMFQIHNDHSSLFHWLFALKTKREINKEHILENYLKELFS